jgi:hypothetical protein
MEFCQAVTRFRDRFGGTVPLAGLKQKQKDNGPGKPGAAACRSLAAGKSSDRHSYWKGLPRSKHHRSVFTKFHPYSEAATYRSLLIS